MPAPSTPPSLSAVRPSSHSWTTIRTPRSPLGRATYLVGTWRVSLAVYSQPVTDGAVAAPVGTAAAAAASHAGRWAALFLGRWLGD